MTNRKTHFKKRALSFIIALTMLLALTPSFMTVQAATTTQNNNSGDGVMLRKSAIPHIDGEGNPDGTVDIIIDAYTTGTVTSQAVSTPTDIVLVLDVSGSMNDYQDVYVPVEYPAAYGERYTTGYIFTNTYYGFRTGTTYYVKVGETYTALTRVTNDANDFIYYRYTDAAGVTQYVYPIMGEGQITTETREFDYPVVQFYTMTGGEVNERKIDTMHRSVGAFIDATLAMNQSVTDNEQKHRIAIIKYADDSYYSGNGGISDINGAVNAVEGNNTFRQNSSNYNYTQLVQNFIAVDSTGRDSLRASVNSLAAGGATSVDYGVTLAQITLNNRSPEEKAARNEVVIVFSDGTPTHSSSYDADVANSAIGVTYAMKNAGVDIYTLSVYNNADGSALGTDNTNQFMHYLSSNFPEAQSMTNPGAGDAAYGYYMTPNEEQTINRIFEKIIENIGNPTMSLSSDTKVADALSPYFTLTDAATPENNVKIQTISKTGPSSYEYDDTPDSNIQLSFGLNNTQIVVTGFDFDANYISTTPRDGGFYGKILRITINVTPNYTAIDNINPRTGDVPTNLETGPAAIISPHRAEPVATTLSPTVTMNKVRYMVDGASFADGYYDVYRLPGSEYNVIFNPEKEGHTFSNWSSDNVTITYNEIEEQYEPFTMPSNDVVISGSYTTNSYDVTYSYVGTIPAGVDESYPATGAIEDILYGNTVTVLPNPPSVPDGYTFSGWSSADVTFKDTDPKTFSMPAKNVAIAGSFKANGNTPFKIEHYLQNVDGTYPDTPQDYYDDYGTTDTEAVATPNMYTGFTFSETVTDDNNESDVTVTQNADTNVYEIKGIIKGDGTRVLKLYYTRNSYVVDYAYAGTEPSGATDISSYGGTYKFGETVDVEAIASAPGGYDFHGWISEQVQQDDAGQFTMPARDVLFTGHFVTNGTTPYTVEHYLQNIDGTYPDTANEVKSHQGDANTPVAAMPIYFEGFLFDENNENNILSGNIETDGSLVLKLYYNREIHKVTYEYIGLVPENAPALPAEATYVFGDEVIIEPDADLVGYTFDGWQSYGGTVSALDTSFTMPNQDVQLRGQFIPQDVNYTVHHIGQDREGNYTVELDDETLTAKTGAKVTAVRKDFTGYTFNETRTGTENQGTVAGDGSLVLNLYYDRDPLYTVEYAFAGYVPAGIVKPDGDTYIEGETVTIELPANVPAGYTFSGWTSYGGAVQPDDTEFTMPARNVHLTGYFTPDDTTYKVEHYWQNAGGDTENYTLQESETETFNAKVDTDVVAFPKTYAGFTYNAVKSDYEGRVEPDGTLTLKMYYDRVPYSVSYMYYQVQPRAVQEANLLPAKQDGKYFGETIDVAPKPTLPGYTFNGWWSSQVPVTADNNAEEFTMPEKDVVLMGSFTPNTDTPYKVEHYTEQEDGSYTLYGEAETFTGTTGETVTATPKSISGYRHNASHPDSILEGFILGDGSFVLKLYYDIRTSDGGGGGSTTKYTLTYESNGGTEYDSERYPAGRLVELDKVPKKEGYIFDGWHTDEERTQDATEVKMTSSKTVYAHWIEDNGNAGNGYGTPDALNGEEHFAYVIGYPDGTVQPHGNITRAEVTSIFFRLIKDEVREQNLSNANSFDDIYESDWYNTAIATMEKLGIVNGRYEGFFAPNENITRAEFAVICARFDNSEFTVTDEFTDVNGHWAEEEIHEAAAHGWIRGYEDGSFRPDRYITRAEAMTMINRVLNRVPENEKDLHNDMTVWPDNSDVSVWYYLPVQEATNSHEYEMKNNIYETWTKVVNGTDWTQYQ